jgi:hypothetical protein
MKCKFCGEALLDAKTGKRPREYCNNAHRQAHYRQQKITRVGTEKAETHSELSQAYERISTLEQTVKTLEECTRGLSHRLLDLEQLIRLDTAPLSDASQIEAKEVRQVEPVQEQFLPPALPLRQIQTQYHDLVSIPLWDKGITFLLPDFTKALQEGYWCDAVEQDVRAWLAVLPARSVRHGYCLTQKMWDKVNPAGKTGRKQEKRARNLLATLVSRVEEAMREAGWVIIHTTDRGVQVWGLTPPLENRELTN